MIIICTPFVFTPGAVARLFQSLKKGAREDEPELRARIDKEARSRRQGARRRRVSTNYSL